MAGVDWLAPLRQGAWAAALADVLAGPDATRLCAWLDAEVAAGHEVLPPAASMFRALALVAPADVRVVIMGQDPYPTPGHAHGLAFSYDGQPPTEPGAVFTGKGLPRSLRNVLGEWATDLGRTIPAGAGNLTPWAGEGVLLLNTVLSVRAGAAGSHRRQGWEALTDAVVATVLSLAEPVVFLLWGNDARRMARRITPPHHVLEAGHPSPLSIRYFRGCRPFSQANALLGARALRFDLAGPSGP